MGIQIAIDGPAGAGKSTIAKKVAEKLGYVYVDTGALYRTLALHFLEEGLAPEDREGMIRSLPTARVSLDYVDGAQRVYLNGEDVTAKLRQERVGHMASVSSVIPEVREHLLALQQELAETYNVVMDGRDIGTRILPKAQVKIFLTASVETRAKRRYKELLEKGEACDLARIEADIRERDTRDSTRATAPLKQASDAILVDSSHLSIEEVTSRILSLCGRPCKEGPQEDGPWK